MGMFGSSKPLKPGFTDFGGIRRPESQLQMVSGSQGDAGASACSVSTSGDSDGSSLGPHSEKHSSKVFSPTVCGKAPGLKGGSKLTMF